MSKEVPNLEDLRRQKEEVIKKAEEIKRTRQKSILEKADESEKIFRDGVEVDKTKTDLDENLKIYESLEKDNLLNDSDKEIFKNTKKIAEETDLLIAEKKEKSKEIISDPDVEGEIRKRAEKENSDREGVKAKNKKEEVVEKKILNWLTTELLPAIEKGKKLFKEREETSKNLQEEQSSLIEKIKNELGENSSILFNDCKSAEKIKTKLEDELKKTKFHQLSLKNKLKNILSSDKIEKLALAEIKYREVEIRDSKYNGNIYGSIESVIANTPSIGVKYKEIEKEALSEKPFISIYPAEIAEKISSGQNDSKLLMHFANYWMHGRH